MMLYHEVFATLACMYGMCVHVCVCVRERALQCATSLHQTVRHATHLMCHVMHHDSLPSSTPLAHCSAVVTSTSPLPLQ